MESFLRVIGANPLVSRAAEIAVKDIALAEWVREECKECRYIGKSWSCPPGVGEIKFLMERLHRYSKAVFVEFSSSKDRKGLEAAVLDIERNLKDAGYPKALGFFVSPCTACEKCLYPDKCCDPGKCRPTGESWGIDLLATSSKAGIPVEIVKAGEDFKPVTMFLLE